MNDERMEKPAMVVVSTGNPISIEQMCQQVGNGWQLLLTTLVDNLYAVGWEGRVVQVKQKFGELRFYIEGNVDAQELANDATGLSCTICDECGVPGQMRYGGYDCVRCDACAPEGSTTDYTN
jgi:hypothetical protein